MPSPQSLIKPPVASLPEELAAAFAKAFARDDAPRVVMLSRLYMRMTPAAKAACDFARAKLALDERS